MFHLSLFPVTCAEGQEMLKGMVEDKIRLQSRATEKYYDQIFGTICGAIRMKR